LAETVTETVTEVREKMTSSWRLEQSRKERLALEQSLEDAAAKRLYDQLAPQREAERQRQEHERRELKRRLLLDADESQDFTYTKYDGRFNGDHAAVTAGIQNAWKAFLELHDLDKSVQQMVTMLLQLHPLADITRVEVFEGALSYLESRLCPAEPAQLVTPVTTPNADEVTGTYADGTPVSELDMETVGNPIFSAACQSICDTSGKPMSGLESKRLYRHFAENSGNSGRRYGRLSVATVRRAARDLWGDESVGLTPEEQRQEEENRIWENLPATEARRALRIPLESNRQPAIAYPKQAL
jgi:hypothetical protein